MDDLEAHLVGGEALERLRERLHRALHVGLENEPQLLDLAGDDLLVQVLEGDAGGALALEPVPIRAHGRDLPRLALVGDHEQRVPRLGDARESQDLHGVRGARAGDLLAAVAEHRAHAPRVGAYDHGVPLLERAGLDERGGDGTTAAVEPTFHDDPAGGAVGIGLQLEDLGLQRRHLEELRDAIAPLRRGGHEDGLSAPVLRHQPQIRQLALHAIGLRSRLVDLVHGHQDGHIGGLGVIHRFDRLGHDSVVGRDHEDDDVGCLSPTRAHGGERLVARRVEEGDLPVGGIDLVGAYVLRDASRLALRHLGGPDGIQQRGLAVVDVTHDRDHGRPQAQLARIDVLLFENVAFERADLDVEMELVGGELGRGGVEHLVHRGHDAQLEQRLDHLAGFPAHGGGELAHRHRFRNLDELALDLDGRLGRCGLGPGCCRLDLDLGRRGGGGRGLHGRRRHNGPSRRRGRRRTRRRNWGDPPGRGGRSGDPRGGGSCRGHDGTWRSGSRGCGGPERRRCGRILGRGGPNRGGHSRGRDRRRPDGHGRRGSGGERGRRGDDWSGRRGKGRRRRGLDRSSGGSVTEQRRRRLELLGGLRRQGLLGLENGRLLPRGLRGGLRTIDLLPGCSGTLGLGDGRLGLGHALGLGLFGEIAAAAELHPQLICRGRLQRAHGPHALLAHRLEGDDQIFAGDSKLFRKVDDLHSCCHSPVTSSA